MSEAQAVQQAPEEQQPPAPETTEAPRSFAQASGAAVEPRGIDRPDLESESRGMQVRAFQLGAAQADTTQPGGAEVSLLAKRFERVNEIVDRTRQYLAENSQYYIGDKLTEENAKAVRQAEADLAHLEQLVRRTEVEAHQTLSQRLEEVTRPPAPADNAAEAIREMEVRNYFRSLPAAEKGNAWRAVLASGDALAYRAVMSAPAWMVESLLGPAASVYLEAAAAERLGKALPGGLATHQMLSRGLGLFAEEVDAARQQLGKLSNHAAHQGPRRSRMTLAEKADYVSKHGQRAYLRLPE